MTQLQDSDSVAAMEGEALSERKLRQSSGSSYLNLLIGISLGIGISLAGYRFLVAKPDLAQKNAAVETEAVVSAQTVTVAPVQMGGVTERLTITGTVQAADLLAVTPLVGGLQIQEVLVEEGDRVVTGQPLAVLDGTELRTQIQQAQAQIEVAKAQLQQQKANLAQAQALLAEAEVNRQRYQSLAAQGAVSSEELDSRATRAVTAREAVGVAEANVTSAVATVRSRLSELARLQTQLNRTTVYAPLEGIVAERPVSVGSLSSAASPIVTLIRNNQLELAGKVPQAQLPQVQVGVPVSITSSTDPDLQLAGTVEDIQPLVDPQTRTAQVIIRLPASERLRSGMFLTADIQVGQRSGLTIPAPALLPQPDGSVRVFVLSPEGTAIARSVEIGVRVPGTGDAPDRVEIVQGLKAGEQVIVDGATYVQDGDVVTVAP